MRRLSLAALCAVGCADLDLGLRPFDGPDGIDVLAAGEGPFDEPVGFVANTRSGTIVPIDVKHGTLLGDQYAAPFLRPRWVATGDQRQLGQIVAWAPAPDQVTVFAADLAYDVLVEAPYVLSASEEPEVYALTHTDPVFVDADGSGDSARLTDIEMVHGATTTEDWVLEYDGEAWVVDGTRSGRQSKRAWKGEGYATDNDELSFEVKGSATAGDRIELSTDCGIVEHELGGPILGLVRVPGEDLLLAAVWDVAAEQGAIVAWDAVTRAEVGRIALPEGAQPWRFAFGAEPGEVYVADAHRDAVYEVALDLATPTSSTWTEIPTDGPVSALAWVADEGDPLAGSVAYEHLFVAPAWANRVDVYDLASAEWLDINPYDDVWGGLDLTSPVVGLSPSRRSIRLQEESNHGARKESMVVALTTFDGALRMFEGGTGCLAIDLQGPRQVTAADGTGYAFSDRGDDSNPLLYTDPATGRQVIPNGCGGVIRDETWTFTYDGIEGNWTVEGSVSGEQDARAWEDERYVSDDGLITFLILSGTAPTTDGDTFQVAMDDGVLAVSQVQRPGATYADPIELPAAPLVFDYDAGPTGGGWDPDRTKTWALVPATDSDLVFRVRLQSFETEAVWY